MRFVTYSSFGPPRRASPPTEGDVVSHKGLALGITSAVLVLMVGIGMAFASGGAISHPTTIKAVGKVTEFGQDGPHPNGPTIANSYALHGVLWNASQTHRIGTFDVACTYTTTKATWALCDATFTFGHQGEISTTGVSPQVALPTATRSPAGTETTAMSAAKPTSATRTDQPSRSRSNSNPNPE